MIASSSNPTTFHISNSPLGQSQDDHMCCDSPSRKQSKANILPVEVLERIFQYAQSSFPIFNESEDKKDRKLLGHPLHACTLVSRRWNAVSNRLLWKHVMVDQYRSVNFVVSLLLSVVADARTAIDPFDSRRGKLSSVEKVLNLVQDKFDIIADSLIPSRGASSQNEDQDDPNTSIDRSQGEQLRHIGDAANPLGHYLPYTDENDSWEQGEDLFRQLLDSLQTDPFITQFFTMVLAQRQSRFRVARWEGVGEIDQVYHLPAHLNKEPLEVQFGKGRFIEKLDIPSRCPMIHLFPLIVDFLPNWQSLGFNHPAHGDDFIPTLSPFLVDSMGPYFSKLTILSVEDVDEDGWVPLISNIEAYGSNLRLLNLEAIPEKETYKSKKSMSNVFANLPKIECLRMDGIPIGHQDYSPFGGDVEVKRLSQTCTFLRALILDYCDVTIKSFYTLWNDCPLLEFLGISGVSGTTFMHEPLQVRQRMKTVRLVDCDISDDIVDNIARNAPNLEMIRLVFEDTQSLEARNITENLSDRLLFSLARHCPKLRILAISRFPGMTISGFQSVCRNPNLQVLDFHTTPNSTFGLIDSEFFQGLIPFLGHVKSINLYGQVEITDADLIAYLNSGKSQMLESVCLNNAMVGPPFLEALLMIHEDEGRPKPERMGPCPNLKRLSMLNCPPITTNDIEWFLYEVQDRRAMHLPHLQKLYFYAKKEDERIRNHPMVEVADAWFVDEGLDIFSLWAKEIRKSQLLSSLL